MILKDYLNVPITVRNITYYKNKGYECNISEEVQISQTDVNPNSAVKEERKCDVCGEIYERPHQAHIITFEKFGKDVCPHCFKTNPNIKREIQKKREATFLKNYGATNVMFVKEEVKKIQDVMLRKYGKTNPQQVEEFKKKQEETMQRLYGVPKALQTKQFQEKFVSTITAQNNVKTSSQQLYCYNLLKENGYDVELNKPFSNCVIDIQINMPNDIKIDLEYDGLFWHNEETAPKERRRDEFLKSNGFKIIRVKSFKMVPSLAQLENAINYVLLPTHSYSSIYLEDSNNKNNK